MKKWVLWTVVIALLASAGVFAAAKAVGTIKLKAPATVLELAFANKQKLNITSKGVSAPEGEYAPESYALLKPARDGKVWRLQNYKGVLGKLKTIKVSAGETTEIDLGAPLKVAPTRDKAERRGRRVTIPISYEITGKSGEAYSLQLWAGNTTARHPHFQILDKYDKVLDEGRLSISAGGG